VIRLFQRIRFLSFAEKRFSVAAAFGLLAADKFRTRGIVVFSGKTKIGRNVLSSFGVKQKGIE